MLNPHIRQVFEQFHRQAKDSHITQLEGILKGGLKRVKIFFKKETSEIKLLIYAYTFERWIHSQQFINFCCYANIFLKVTMNKHSIVGFRKSSYYNFYLQINKCNYLPRHIFVKNRKPSDYCFWVRRSSTEYMYHFLF